MTWGDAMKDIKEKPTAHMPRSNATGEIPKAALKKAWAEAKEKSRTMLRESTSTQGDGDYTTAQDTSSVVTDTSYSVIKQNTDFTVQQGRKIARKQIEKYRERRSAEQTETIRVHTANERGVSPKQVECSTLSDAERHPRRGADLPRQRAKEKVVTAKTAPRDIRGVTQGQRQLRTAANETVRSITTQAQMQTRTRQVQLAIQKAASSTCKTAVAVRSAIRHFLVGLHSLVAAIAAGISVALSIIIVISLVAFVSGSAYGIFFAANAPNADTITVQQAVETLTAEYRDRLEEISDTVQHDRQDITANDDVYYIRWQDVLAVFSSYVSGNEQGTPVAALTEEQVDKLRETMWAMNAVDCSTHPETTTIETTDEDGNPTTTEITETVLVIELTHKTPDEMAADYHFTTRQNTYLQLLQDPQYEELWAELLGGFAQGGGELMNPDSTRIPTGTLQWPLPVAGTITSQFGHRVDPITGEVSSHTGTDIACAEGTPILAAADGVVTVANGLDSWGGSYGYYIQIDHGGGLETLCAHCSSICVTTGQQVQAGQVIGYVGHTGRATGSHLHFEIVTKQMFREVQAEIARRNSKSAANQRKRHQGRYNSKYALSERLVCGDCGSPYKRVTWNIHGRKQIVWRCVNRLEYGTKFCSHSPSIPEEELHQAILKAVQNLAANFTDEVAAQLDGILRQMKAGENLKAQLQKQLEKAQQEFDRLLEMSLELDESTPFLDDKLRKLSGKIKILKANIAESTDGKGEDEEATKQLTAQDLLIKEYDDILTARIIEKVIVHSRQEIEIYFIGGYTQKIDLI